MMIGLWFFWKYLLDVKVSKLAFTNRAFIVISTDMGVIYIIAKLHISKAACLLNLQK